MTKRLILCDCSGSQPLDAATLEKTTELACSRVYTELCGKQLDQAAKEIASGDALVACLQEREIFQELAAEIEAPQPEFIDLRDRAGWTAASENPAPKMAALVSDSLLQQPPEKQLEITSYGQCLILGDAKITLPAAGQLAENLSVTVLLDTPTEAPLDRRFDVVIGHLKKAVGSLGNFTVSIDSLQQFNPGGRGERGLSAPRNGAKTECDLILDLRGSTPLFPAAHKRDGYLRADPKDPTAVARTLFEAAQLEGSFEKPFYLDLQEHLCAHSRAQIAGCSKCIDNCCTAAISPAGDHVAIDPAICAGCGSCVALCPSGAITFAAPPTEFTFKRMHTLAQSFVAAGGKNPRLLVHDAEFGSEMISLAARFAKGLPADVIPLEVSTLCSFGHAEMLAALTCGFASVDVLLAPKTERETLNSELALAQAIAGTNNLRLLDIADPDALSEILYQTTAHTPKTETILPQGSRRQITRQAAIALNGKPETPVPLPTGAPYGAVVVDNDACTLCLSCASLCPTGALGDNPDMPQLRFQEDACLQCGLCTRVCPENAITLKPQFDLSDQALSETVLHEEEPFACVECGSLFGVKSTIEKISEKLAGKHDMFATNDTARLIQMCDNCRIHAQYHATDNPFQGRERPRVVTTEDYFSKRRDH